MSDQSEDSRPPAGPGLFDSEPINSVGGGAGSPRAGGAEAYRVLARKYRPGRLSELIGQEAMVRTLTNAFATGRIAHAFMLTGVRGVGKTTT
ncbi:MAG: DNA polymerase III subunit gamma/tau, partial [Acetobacteraceae bacterium]